MMAHVSDGVLPVEAIERSRRRLKRAIEAVVLVAHDPVAPELLAQLLEQPVTDVERWCDELAAGYDDQEARLRARPRRRRLPLPDPPRPDALRRALPAQRPAGPPVRGGARDAGDRRLQAADLAGADRLDPRRRPRRRAAHAAGARLHRRRRPRSRPGPGRAVRHDRQFLEKLGLDSHRRPPADRRVHPRRRRGRGASRPACGSGITHAARRRP